MEDQARTENIMRVKIKKFRKATQLVVVAVALIATGVIFYFVGRDTGWSNGYVAAYDEINMTQTENYDYNYDYDYDYNNSDDTYTSATEAHRWTCDWCGTEWEGTAYYARSVSDTLCAECANQYWRPLPISNYTKPEE